MREPTTVDVTIHVDDELFDLTMWFLRYDDSHPEVGMGLFPFMALDHATEAFNKKYGTKFNSKDFEHVLERVDKEKKR